MPLSASAVVNNAVYQNYLEQAAVVEHSEYLGLTLNVHQELGGVFVILRVEIDYLRPAVVSDTLEVIPIASTKLILLSSLLVCKVDKAVPSSLQIATIMMLCMQNLNQELQIKITP